MPISQTEAQLPVFLYMYQTVLRIRVRNSELFYRLDPVSGSGMHFFRIRYKKMVGSEIKHPGSATLVQEHRCFDCDSKKFYNYKV
jgi:hypothetical protein